MASDYDNKRFSIELMKTGEKVGSWGDVTNVNWESISSAIGSRTELNIDTVTGSSTYVTGTGILTLLLPNDTSPDAGTWDSGSRAAYISVTNTTQPTPASGIVKLRICGNVSTEEVDRFYFIKNSLGKIGSVPLFPIVLRVYNADDGTFVSVAAGSTLAVSLSSTATAKIVDITNQLQVGKLDFTGIAAGSAEIFIKDGDANSLKVMQLKEDSSTREVYSIGTTKGVTSVALGGTAGGYGNSGTYDLGFTSVGPGTGAKGTFFTSGAGGTINSTITITAEGEGYTLAPTIDFANAQGVNTLSITSIGSGYTPSSIAPLAFGGSPTVAATGTVTIDPSGILNVPVVTSRGAGYTTAPSVTVAPTDGLGSGGAIDAFISTGATGAATIAEASVVDLTGSTTKITKGIIEQSTIGAATPLSGKFTTLESTGDTTIGSSATNTIDITGLIDGPIAFKNDAVASSDIGTSSERVRNIETENITMNKAGTDEVRIEFRGAGDTGADNPGTTTELKGKIFTAAFQDSMNLDASRGMTDHGGIRLQIQDTTRKAYIVRGTGLTGLSSVTLTDGGSGYTPNGLDQTLDLDGTVPIPTTDAILLYDVIGGIVSNMRLSHPGSGFSGTFPSDTTDPIPTGGTGSACTYTTASVPGTTDTEIGSLHNSVAQFLGGGIQNASYTSEVVSGPALSQYVEKTFPCGDAEAGKWGEVPHGATIIPKMVFACMRCTSADVGYATGDELNLSQASYGSISNNMHVGSYPAWNADDVFMVSPGLPSSAGIWVLRINVGNKGAGSWGDGNGNPSGGSTQFLDTAKWEYVVRMWW